MSCPPGIGWVTGRIETSGLKILRDGCPRLLHEAELYRYPDALADSRVESPKDEHNHALTALRYLISRLIAFHRRGPAGGRGPRGRRHEPASGMCTDLFIEYSFSTFDFEARSAVSRCAFLTRIQPRWDFSPVALLVAGIGSRGDR